MVVTKQLIIDFDSTFITGESLDWLAEIANPSVISKLSEITKQGMDGTITYQESLTSRLDLFWPNKNHINQLIEKINRSITPSVISNKNWIIEHRDNIYIISGGFIDYIQEPLTSFGILPNHIFGNSFIFDKDRVVGFDENNLLSQSGGKAHIVKNLALDGEVMVVGDGITDFEIKEQGAADMFIAFTENMSRSSVTKKADVIARSFTEIISLYES